MSDLTNIDAATLARIDQLTARGSANLDFVTHAGKEVKALGWDFPAVAALLAYKLDTEAEHLTRTDMALMVGVAVARLLEVAQIAKDARNELLQQ